FTSVRDRPHIACARAPSPRLASVSSAPSSLGSTSSARVQASWPFGPFTVTVWPSTVTVTPFGTAIGFFPIRDILVDPAEYFAAAVGVARGVVRHDALRRRQDRDPKAVLHGLQVLDRRIDAAARLGDAADLDDDRLAIEVLQLDLELREGAGLFHQVVATDVAFLQQDIEDARSHLPGRRVNLAAVALGRVLDAGDQIANGIVDHGCPSYQLDLTRPGIRPADPRSRSEIRLIFSLR